MIKTAIAFNNIKDAALYLDFVVPIGIAFEINPIEPMDLDSLLAKLLPTELKDDLEFIKLLKIWLRSWLIQRKEGVKRHELKMDPQILISAGYILTHYMTNFNQNDYLFFGKDIQVTSDSVSDNFISTIMRLELIDTSKIDWDKILSIRKDPEAHNKLRRLRLLFEKDYSDKSLSFIEDDILRRIEDYENIVKDWRLETRIGLLEQLISSKSFPAFLGGSIAALFLNSPEIAGASVLSGTCIEIGKIAIEYAKRIHKLNTLTRDLPVGYIVDLRKAS